MNYQAIISLESIIDGAVINGKESPREKVKHLRLVENSNLNQKGCYVEMATRDCDVHIATGAAIRVYDPATNNNKIKVRKFSVFGEQSVEYCDYDAQENETVAIDKFVVTYTSRDVAKNELKNVVDNKMEEFLLTGLELERLSIISPLT